MVSEVWQSCWCWSTTSRWGCRGRVGPRWILFKVTSVGWCGGQPVLPCSPGFSSTGILADTRSSAHRFRNFYMRAPSDLSALLRHAPGLVRPGPLAESLDQGIPRGRTGLALALVLRHQHSDFSPGEVVSDEPLLVVGRRGAFLSGLALLLVFTLDRRTAIRVCLGMIGLALVVRIWQVQHGLVLSAYTLTLSRMDGLALGALIALAIRGEQGLEAIVPLAKKGAQLSGAAILLVALWRVGLRFHDSVVQTLGYLLLDLFFASGIVVLVAAPKVAPLARLFNLSVLRTLGRYSYGIYVYNSIFILIADGLAIPSGWRSGPIRLWSNASSM